MDSKRAIHKTATAFLGKRVVFTGKLASMTRSEAGRIVLEAGGEVQAGVSRHTSLVVIGMEGWPLFADGRISNKLKHAEEINKLYGFPQIVSESAFLEMAGLQEKKCELRKTYSSPEVCRLLGIEPEVLERWEQFSLIGSQDGMFDFQDIVTLRMIVTLLHKGVRCETIATSIRGLASILPDTDRPLSQLKIVAETPNSLLADLGDCRLAPDGQLAFNFEIKPQPEVQIVEHPANARTAMDWVKQGQKLEEEEDSKGAENAYLRAIGIQPDFPEAFFNLANLLRMEGREHVAETSYLTCIKQDPTFVAAWISLASLQEAQGRIQEAIVSLETATRISPTFADAFFNLAACLEKTGNQMEANKYWAAYLKLDSSTHWAEIARKHLQTGNQLEVSCHPSGK